MGVCIPSGGPVWWGAGQTRSVKEPHTARHISRHTLAGRTVCISVFLMKLSSWQGLPTVGGQHQSRPPALLLTEVGGPQPVRAESGLREWSSEGPPTQDWVLGGRSWSQPRPTCTHFLLLNKRIFVEQWRECPRGGASLSPPSPPQLRWLHRPHSGPRGGPWLFLLPSSLGSGRGSADPAPPWPGVAVSWLL